MREAPQPNYDYDVKKVVKAYERALKDVQQELNDLFLTDFERAQLIATERNVRSILSDMTKYSDEWASVAVAKSATKGVASTIYSLGLAPTYEEALKIARFNAVNKRLVAAAIADTQADLLAVTQNIERQAKLAIRKATAEAMRHTLTRGNNATQDIAREIRQRIVQATDAAIIDARGNRWKVGNYADVVARTNMMNAHREASINEALSEESYYARISSHGAKDACRFHEGRIIKLIDDAPGDYLTYNEVRTSGQIWHPRCKHIITPLRNPQRFDSRKPNFIYEKNTTKSTYSHATLGEFTRNPRTKQISRMTGGGHGEDNIEFLTAQEIEYNIEKTFSNGVRIGNVPIHKTKVKKDGIGQSWFPEDWTSKDINDAGLFVANDPNNKLVDGFKIFGIYKNIEIGVFLSVENNKQINTIFPTNKQTHLKEGE